MLEIGHGPPGSRHGPYRPDPYHAARVTAVGRCRRQACACAGYARREPPDGGDRWTNWWSGSAPPPGLEPETAHKAIGIVLNFIQQQVPPETGRRRPGRRSRRPGGRGRSRGRETRRPDGRDGGGLMGLANQLSSDRARHGRDADPRPRDVRLSARARRRGCGGRRSRPRSRGSQPVHVSGRRAPRQIASSLTDIPGSAG